MTDRYPRGRNPSVRKKNQSVVTVYLSSCHQKGVIIVCSRNEKIPFVDSEQLPFIVLRSYRFVPLHEFVDMGTRLVGIRKLHGFSSAYREDSTRRSSSKYHPSGEAK